MKKLRFIWMFLVVTAVISISNFAFATLTTFDVIIDQLDISRDGGRTWVTLVNTPTTFQMMNLRGGNASQWFSGVKVPAGRYNKWRAHIIWYHATTAVGGGDIAADDQGSIDTWDSGDMNVVVDSGGNTSAIWNFDADDSYTIHGPADIELNPQITVQ